MREHSTADALGPDAARVAARALVLGTIVCRGLLELDEDKQASETYRLSLLPWCDRVGLVRELEYDEVYLLTMPVDALDPQQPIDAIWQAEGMLVLAWALGRVKLESYDTQCDSSEVASRLGWLKERPDTILENAVLRPRAEIEAWANTYLTLHWRLRQHQLDLDQGNPGPIDLADYVARSKWGPLTVANIRLIDGDLAVGGDRIDLADEDAFERTFSIVRERHKAFNWLRGGATLYSEVRTPT